jgi:hypothetical protein
LTLKSDLVLEYKVDTSFAHDVLEQIKAVNLLKLFKYAKTEGGQLAMASDEDAKTLINEAKRSFNTYVPPTVPHYQIVDENLPELPG